MQQSLGQLAGSALVALSRRRMTLVARCVPGRLAGVGGGFIGAVIEVISIERGSIALDALVNPVNRVGGLVLQLLGLGLGGGQQTVLHRRGVHVDVLLTRQEHQLVHELIGDRAQDEPVVLHAFVTGEVQGLADAHADAHDLGDLLAVRLRLVRANHGHRQDGTPRLERHPGHADAPAIQPAIRRAGAFGIDAEQLAPTQDLEAAVERNVTGTPTGTVHRQLTGTLEEGCGRPALDASAGEVVGLGQAGDPPRKHQRQEDGVGEREVVAGEDRGALWWDVRLALDPRAEQQPQDRPENQCLEHPVEQRGPPPTCETSHPLPTRELYDTMRGWHVVRGFACSNFHRFHRRLRSESVTILPGAEPFSHDGSDVGVLLCHGFTGTPQSMRPWGEYLADRGYTVRVPLLPGHGTTWQEMNNTRWEDWYAGVDTAFRELNETCERVVVGGLSMGATLALKLAQEHGPHVSGLILVNPAVKLEEPLINRLLIRLLPVVKHVVPSLGAIGNDVHREGVTELAYTRNPLKALHSQLGDAFPVHVIANRPQRRHDMLHDRKQADEEPVDERLLQLDRGVDQDQATDVRTVFLRQLQRQSGPHGQSADDDAFAGLVQLAEGRVDAGVPVFPPGVVHLLPGGAVPGQKGNTHRIAAVGEVLAPWTHAPRRTRQPVAQQHPDVGSVMAERFGSGQNGHGFAPESSMKTVKVAARESSHDVPPAHSVVQFTGRQWV